MSDRLEQLRALLAEDPADNFVRYAIALERKRAGDMQGGANDLEALLNDDPKYVAAYYQLALMLADLGRTQEAAHVCEIGSLQALTTGDRKARAELVELKNTLTGDDA
jgi:thioredoxin-like negative regulator of GroEL